MSIVQWAFKHTPGNGAIGSQSYHVQSTRPLTVKCIRYNACLCHDTGKSLNDARSVICDTMSCFN